MNSPAGSSDVQFYAKKPHILLLYTLYWAMAKLPPKTTSIYLLDSLRFVGKATPIFEVFIFFTIRHNRFHSQCACNIVFMGISKCCRSNTRGIHYLKAIYFYKILFSDRIALDLLFFPLLYIGTSDGFLLSATADFSLLVELLCKMKK